MMLSKIEVEQSYFPDVTEKSQYVLYETFVDTQSESMMEKIRLNEDEFRRLKSDTESLSQVKCIGMYGKFAECSRIALQFLMAKMEPESRIKDFKEGIVVFRHIDRLAFVYKTQEDSYAYDKQKKLSTHTPTYLRYLIDITEHIYAVTDENFKLNPDLTSPFE